MSQDTKPFLKDDYPKLVASQSLQRFSISRQATTSTTARSQASKRPASRPRKVSFQSPVSSSTVMTSSLARENGPKNDSTLAVQRSVGSRATKLPRSVSMHSELVNTGELSRTKHLPESSPSWADETKRHDARVIDQLHKLLLEQQDKLDQEAEDHRAHRASLTRRMNHDLEAFSSSTLELTVRLDSEKHKTMLLESKLARKDAELVQYKYENSVLQDKVALLGRQLELYKPCERARHAVQEDEVDVWSAALVDDESTPTQSGITQSKHADRRISFTAFSTSSRRS